MGKMNCLFLLEENSMKINFEKLLTALFTHRLVVAACLASTLNAGWAQLIPAAAEHTAQSIVATLRNQPNV